MKALKKTVTTQPKTAAELLQQLDMLHMEREEFENGLQTRSNEKLYEICGLVYGQYRAVKDNKELLKAAVTTMKTRLEDRGHRVQSNSSILGLFVRYVFNGTLFERRDAGLQPCCLPWQQEAPPVQPQVRVLLDCPRDHQSFAADWPCERLCSGRCSGYAAGHPVVSFHQSI